MSDPYADIAAGPAADPYAAIAHASPAPSKAFAAGTKASKGFMGGLTGALATAEEVIPFADEAQAAISSVGRMAQGEKPGEAWKNSREYQRGLMTGFQQDHPVLSNLSKSAGYSADLVPLLMTGGAAAPEVAASAGAKPLARRVMSVAGRATKNAVTGATLASTQALAGRGDAEQRLEDARAAAPVGAVVGLAVPAAVSMTGRAMSAAGDVAGRVARTGVRAANKIADAGEGGAFLDPKTEVIKRLTEAMQRDGLTPEQVGAAVDEWNRVGGASPALVDIVSQGGGGQNTMALIRGAAMSGAGRNVASKYGAKVAGDMQDVAIDRTRALTPDETRPANAVTGELRKYRRSAANEMYPAFAEHQVPVGDDILSAADGSADWMQGAAKMAVAERKFDVADEIAALVNGQKPKQVTAGALDYMRRALRDAATAAGRRGEGGLAEGLRSRAQDLETALMDVPGFRTARDTYKGFSRQIEAVDGNPQRGVTGGRQLLMTSPDEYQAAVEADNPATAPLRMVGGRQALTDAIGAPAGNATGLLNRLATGTNTGRNLASTFGENPAADYRASLSNLIDKTNTARSINPNTGSPTALRLSDEQLVELPTSKAGVVKWIVDKFRSGATLTDAEREELVKLATSEPGETMQHVGPRMQTRIPLPRMTTGAIPTQPGLALPMTDQENRR
jgi:hypothetical protein